MKASRNRKINTPLAKRLRRLGWNLKDAQRWTGEPYGSLKNWNQERNGMKAPRAVMRLLAVYRLLHWGKF